MSLIELAGIADELCHPHRHTEPVYEHDVHRNRRLRRVVTTVQDGLLQQLHDAACEGLKVGDSTVAGGKPASRPPGSFEALHRHVYITAEVRRWCDALGLPPRATVEDGVHALVGAAGALDDDTRHRLLREARHWRGQAAAATGWTSPPYTPPVPCPGCRRNGSIRINLGTRAAYCVNGDRDPAGELLCGAVWEAGTVVDGSPLVTYIRAVTEAA